MPAAKVKRRLVLCAAGAALTALPTATGPDSLSDETLPDPFDLVIIVNGAPLLVTAAAGSAGPLVVH